MTTRRLRTSLHLQRLEYRVRVLALAFLILLPVGFWAVSFFSLPANGRPVSPDAFEPYSASIGPLVAGPIAERDTWPVDTMFMGVGWALGAAGLFSVIGSGARDRRLVLAGFEPWEIMLARFLILIGIAVPISLLPVAVIDGFSSLTPPSVDLVWLGSFFAAVAAGAVGLIVGSLLPRPLEGTLLLIGIIGVEASLPFNLPVAHYLPLFGPQALYMAGRYTDAPIVLVHVVQSLVWISVLSTLAIALWTWKVRVHREATARAVLDPHPD